MEKDNIYLRNMCPEDEPWILDILTSDILKQTYMLPDFECRESALPLFQKLVSLSKDTTHYVRGICCNTQLVGFLNDVEIQNDTIELGYVIHPSFHCRGYMTQALKTAITDLFSIGYHEVIAGAFEENTASIRVMEKAGMIRQAKIDMIAYRGRTHRCVYYCATKSETNGG